MYSKNRFTRCPDPTCRKPPTIANPRIYQTIIAGMALVLGIWFLVIELHENEERWRKTAGVAIFHGNLPPVPQYSPATVPSLLKEPTPIDIGLTMPTRQAGVIGHRFTA
ncbi:uncharacterized protein N7511_001426 [Penicillium nucicola]|uniref:uncharacterized protein n=1 Tax=Penicillium nucicola TaxID=1850975 RepID=UPI00254538FC|nr:uncharacterized protein N7511_001426 [Penicillium nucicola]KAJ5776415.1 hypothetical protein N7511_001426 [Penicillium nucicola]